MKNINQHVKTDLLLLGYTNPAIHSFLDMNAKIFGPAHRFDNHHYRTVKLIDSFYGNKDGNIALLHILLDLHILNDKIIKNLLLEKKEED